MGVKHEASSESGECASLISTGDFSVYEAVLVGLPVGLGIPRHSWPRSPERRSAPRGAARETDRKNVRIAGAARRRAGRFLQGKASISAPGETRGKEERTERAAIFEDDEE